MWLIHTVQNYKANCIDSVQELLVTDLVIWVLRAMSFMTHKDQASLSNLFRIQTFPWFKHLLFHLHEKGLGRAQKHFLEQ